MARPHRIEETVMRTGARRCTARPELVSETLADEVNLDTLHDALARLLVGVATRRGALTPEAR
jgi:hypothetical protein